MQQPPNSFIFLSHGGSQQGQFKLPHNVELVTFNRPGLSFDQYAVKEIMNTLRLIPSSLVNRIRPGDKALSYSINSYNVVQSINVTYYKPGSYAPNLDLRMSLSSSDPLQNLTGLFDSRYADIDVINNTKLSGSYDWFDSNFTNLFLNNNRLTQFTTQTLVNYFSSIYPFGIARIYMISCRALDNYMDLYTYTNTIFSLSSLIDNNFYFYPVDPGTPVGILTYKPSRKRRRTAIPIAKRNLNTLAPLTKRPKTNQKRKSRRTRRLN